MPLLHNIMEALRRWLPILVLVGVVADFGISWALIASNSQSHCWDNVLDQAITHHPSKAEHAQLYREAHVCAGG